MKYSFLLVGVCVVVFILQASMPSLTDYLVLRPSQFSPITFITHIFSHASFDHLFSNMFALALFGYLLESALGSKKFLILFFLAGFVAGISAFIFYYDSAVLGASGAIMGILGALGVLRPRMIVWVMGMPMPMIAAVGVWAFIDFAGLLSQATGIANGAHLFGLFAGLIYGFLLRERYKDKIVKKKNNIKISEDELRKWEDEWM